MTGPDIILSIDVGGTRTKLGLVDLAGWRLQGQVVRPTCTGGLDAYLASLRGAFADVCESASVKPASVRGCAIGLPGCVIDGRVSAMWESLAFLEGDGLLPALEASLEMPVRADNDARVVALGEARFGRRPAARRLLSLTLGSGLGFGLVVDGKLQEQSSVNHLAGHIPVRPTGERCFCGFRGCLEVLVGAGGLLRSYREGCAVEGSTAEGDVSSAEAVFASAGRGTRAGLHAVRQWLADLSAGINAYIHLFAPDVIVFGGGLSRGLQPWLADLEASIFAAPFDGYGVALEVSSLQEQAGVLGAAALFLP